MIKLSLFYFFRQTCIQTGKSKFISNGEISHFFPPQPREKSCKNTDEWQHGRHQTSLDATLRKGKLPVYPSFCSKGLRTGSKVLRSSIQKCIDASGPWRGGGEYQSVWHDRSVENPGKGSSARKSICFLENANLKRSFQSALSTITIRVSCFAHKGIYFDAQLTAAGRNEIQCCLIWVAWNLPWLSSCHLLSDLVPARRQYNIVTHETKPRERTSRETMETKSEMEKHLSLRRRHRLHSEETIQSPLGCCFSGFCQFLGSVSNPFFTANERQKAGSISVKVTQNWQKKISTHQKDTQRQETPAT